MALSTKLYVFIVKDCGLLENPANGSVNTSSGTTYGKTATYSCTSGRRLCQGCVATRTCLESGKWSHNAPTCVGKYLLLPSVAER